MDNRETPTTIRSKMLKEFLQKEPSCKKAPYVVIYGGQENKSQKVHLKTQEKPGSELCAHLQHDLCREHRSEDDISVGQNLRHPRG